ncbi:nuclear transport factor 2 family protein [Andreprevotia chitinilytica]|uniref:nuclear transport factor 2 family protein n=1 Tax=Andreprevotia chitinilytica TaxID=396808 RepID=UPI000558D46B|nr:nuclear transport factor 2 family protein [Andreprevotia chitinilytica]
MPQALQQLFEQYRDAFNRLDGEAIARFYAVPSGIAQDGIYTHWADFEAIRSNMVGLCNLYRDNGYVTAHFEHSTFLPQGPNHAVVSLSWHIDRSQDQEPWRFQTSYNLLRTESGWRILLCTAYEEQRLDC